MNLDHFMKQMLDVSLETSNVKYYDTDSSFKKFLKSMVNTVRPPDNINDIPITSLYQCLYYNEYNKKSTWGSTVQEVLAKDIVFWADDVLYKTHYVGKEVFEVNKVYKLSFKPVTIEEAKADKPAMFIFQRLRKLK